MPNGVPVDGAMGAHATPPALVWGVLGFGVAVGVFVCAGWGLVWL